jgi:ketosteroid isomerase-like protein
MSERAMDIAQRGFRAWIAGDFDTVESILDAGVQWHGSEPGEWDCLDRDDVMQVVRERHEQGFARGGLQFIDGGPDVVIVVSHPREIAGPEWPSETATVITFKDGRVREMRDYRTKADALRAIA